MPTPYLGLFREEAERCLAFMPAAQGVVKWPSARPTLTALVDETDLPLPDAAVDRVLIVHALEMSHDAVALLREAWRVLAAGGRLLAVVPNRRGVWARMDTTPFGHGRPYSRSQITHLLRETWFTPTGWDEALYVPPIAAQLVPALGRRLGAHRRDAVRAVRRRPHRRGDQAGLSRRSGAPRAAPPGAGARAGAGAVARRRGADRCHEQPLFAGRTARRLVGSVARHVLRCARLVAARAAMAAAATMQRETIGLPHRSRWAGDSP